MHNGGGPDCSSATAHKAGLPIGSIPEPKFNSSFGCLGGLMFGSAVPRLGVYAIEILVTFSAYMCINLCARGS